MNDRSITAERNAIAAAWRRGESRRRAIFEYESDE